MNTSPLEPLLFQVNVTVPCNMTEEVFSIVLHFAERTETERKEPNGTTPEMAYMEVPCEDGRTFPKCYGCARSARRQ